MALELGVLMTLEQSVLMTLGLGVLLLFGILGSIELMYPNNGQ